MTLKIWWSLEGEKLPAHVALEAANSQLTLLEVLSL